MYVLSSLEEHGLWALLTMLMLITLRSCRSCPQWERGQRQGCFEKKIPINPLLL
ncbi:hypothetical protein EJ02DRAFT_245186 [Clathrospora elynae]|uniref:Uncharacterized protein n=1 Tax=Clathrospora elynae TaxID=706981 RepID=A0A6A5SGL7_9PLEO|nr:hypothetical protein EJ02DRAFT_245186 [Clathrospora elynae]